MCEVKEAGIGSEYAVIPAEEYEELLHKEMWLQALEEAGVDNWPGCGKANEIMKQWIEELSQ